MRALKLYPMILAFTIVLVMGIGIILGGVLTTSKDDENKMAIRVGLVGDISGSYLGIGIEAVKNFDSSRFYAELIECTEEEAKKMLEADEIMAYALIPDDFIESVKTGENYKIKFIIKNSPAVLTTLTTKEVTDMISNVLVDTQKGVYGYREFFDETDISYDERAERTAKINLDYIKQVLQRETYYDIEYIGAGNNLNFVEYYFCAFLILLMLLCGIICINLLVKTNLSLERSLLSRGNGLTKQVIAEYLPFLTIISVNVLLVFITLGVCSKENLLGGDFLCHVHGIFGYLSLAVSLLPAIVLICSMQFFLYELTSNIISAVLLQILSVVALSYASGLLYPLYSMPEAVQKIAGFLPTGVAFNYVAGLLTDSPVLPVILLCYTLLFVSLAIFVRRIKIRGSRI